MVCHLHGHSDQRPSDIAFLNRHVDRFVPVSQFVADQWQMSGLDLAKITVVHNAIDPGEYPAGGLAERDRARRLLGVPDDTYVACYLGRLDTEKGVDVLLRAWHRLGLPPNRGQLLLVGSSVADRDGGSHLAELHRLAGPGVVFLGNRRDVVTPLHAADVLVVPSLFDEPFGRRGHRGLGHGTAGDRLPGRWDPGDPDRLVGPIPGCSR